MHFKRSKKPQRSEPGDIPLTAIEAQAIAEVCESWPPGMGVVLVRAHNKRGWKADPDFNVFAPIIPEGAKVCPVMQVKLMRGGTCYGDHLAAFRAVRDAYAQVFGLSLEAAKELYNSHLKREPRKITEAMFTYQRMLLEK